jgi:hypothetical protein
MRRADRVKVAVAIDDKSGSGMPSSAEHQAAARQQKLDDMRALIEDGTLTVRQMTPAERELNPARTDKPLRKRPKQ